MNKLVLLAGSAVNVATLLLTWYTYSTYGENAVWFVWVPIPMAIISMVFLIRYYAGRKNEVRS